MNDKYIELIKEIARIITNGETERTLLQIELDNTKAQLEKAEAYIAQLEREEASGHA